MWLVTRAGQPRLGLQAQLLNPEQSLTEALGDCDLGSRDLQAFKGDFCHPTHFFTYDNDPF